ncbi:Abi family protein [Thioalkalivibrio sp.]|uniref:Abi family protein n=1 Tax=Thioalkalivibrio sp. TaxID=2093813 RepID=UPI003976D975
MDFTKPARTHQEQLELLQSRGLHIEDRDRALHYLRHLNYYRLTAYWLPLEADHETHRFRQGASFDAVLNLYVFDREFRLLLLDAIERVEVSLRAGWAYHMAHQHGPHAYLDASLSVRGDWHARHLAKLEAEVSRSDETFVEHYRNTYLRPATPPIWAVCEVMSLGLLSRWITHLRPHDRQVIAKPYGLNQQVLQAFVRHLTYVRNLCAHHSRVWNRRLTITMKLPRKPRALAEVINANEPRRLYNTLVILGYLLDIISPNHHWKQRLGDLIRTHDIDATLMGFPADWKERDFWSVVVGTGSQEGSQ